MLCFFKYFDEMLYFLKYFSLILLVFVLMNIITGCQQSSGDDIYTSSGRLANTKELSAGRSTIFTSSSKAYDTPADWVSDNLSSRFNSGDNLYDTPRVTDENSLYGGLGPVYCGYSCSSCHNNSGRTTPTLFTNGGSGNYGFSSFLTYLFSHNNNYFRDYGRVLHDQAVYGSKPEGKLHVSYSEKTYSFSDGEKYSLITPKYWITDWYSDSIKSEDLYVSIRIPLRHVGLGQMMALDQNEILRLAAKQYPEYGISGKVNWVTERNKKVMGISGNKAQHGDLTVELGFSSDMGVTSDRFPQEVSAGQSQSPSKDPGKPEISAQNMADVDFYLHALGVPARRNINNATVMKGEQLFHLAKCDLCHVTTLHTRSTPPQLIDGTTMPWLCNQTIHPYSDFLVHDMGPELGDDYAQFLARGDEWRTTPLWGIGLQETINGHTYFLHDGRARNFIEAIMWHGGEGSISRNIFKNMPKADRDALVTFLKSL
jgi:CxxC motif-containing protein (DUF1111 family)